MCPTTCFKSDSVQEIWRIRLNWLFLIITGSLYSISYTAISSSFHQFMTNPKSNSLNNTEFEKFEPGLGQTETFYSWVITLFNIGALIGGFASGCLVKFIPYWHLILFSLVLHTIGYILYAISNEGWLIMISKLLSGWFIGAELTLALSYFAESSIDYKVAMKQIGKGIESSAVVRNSLFAWHNIGVNVGYFLGPGAAALFAQFKIDQFRTIAWYNVAFGVLLIVLQLILFHGESEFKAMKRCQLCRVKLSDLNISAMDLFILVFLIICRGVLSFRFGVYETIYNPVLSDYFGLTEQDCSYFFFGLVVAQTSGTILLLVFQHIKLNSRVIAIIGLLMTTLSCAIIADWQSIPYDPCTELSPFHHADMYKDVKVSKSNHLKRSSHCLKEDLPKLDFSIYLSSKIDLRLIPVSANDVKCNKVSTCSHLCNDEVDHCWYYTLDRNQCIEESTVAPEQFLLDKTASNFLCKQAFNGSLHSVCVTAYQKPHHSQVNDQVNDGLYTVNVQALLLLEVDIYAKAVNACESAKFQGQHCYWIPNSIVSHKHCSDCQPICRSLHHSLTFAQFCIGAALLMVSIPIAWVPVATLISDRVHREAQGLVMGVVVALTAIGRSVSPLWLDAAYEGAMKRTFIAMFVLVATHLPFLIGIILMYRQLGVKPNESAFKDLKEDKRDSDSDTDSEKDLDNFVSTCSETDTT